MTTTRPDALGRIASLDGVRGIAALVVLVHHAFLLFPAFARLEYREDTVPTPLEAALTFTPLHIIWAGDEAVLVFFVLSGLVLTLPIFRPSRFVWIAYFPSRVIRLYLPVLAAVLLAALLFAFAPWGPGPAGRGAPIPVTLPQVLLDASLSRGSASYLDNALWSLHYEVLFSLLLPLYVLVIRRTRSWVLPVIASIALSSFARMADVQLVAFLAVFAIGVALARHRDRIAQLHVRIEQLRHPSRAWAVLAVGSTTALMASWYPVPVALARLLGWPLLLIGATGCVILAATWPALRRTLDHRLVRWAGTLSFSLYLTHLPIVSAIGHALGPDRAWAAFVISVPVALLAAWVFLNVVERPGHRLARRVARLVERQLGAITRSRSRQTDGRRNRTRLASTALKEST